MKKSKIQNRVYDFLIILHKCITYDLLLYLRHFSYIILQEINNILLFIQLLVVKLRYLVTKFYLTYYYDKDKSKRFVDLLLVTFLTRLVLTDNFEIKNLELCWPHQASSDSYEVIYYIWYNIVISVKDFHGKFLKHNFSSTLNYHVSPHFYYTS